MSVRLPETEKIILRKKPASILGLLLYILILIGKYISRNNRLQ